MDRVPRFGRGGGGSSPSRGTNMKNKKSKNKNQKLFLITLVAGFFLLSANKILAACPTGIVPCGGPDCPCTFCDFFKLIHNIINFFLVPCPLNSGFAVVPTITVLMLVFGGLYLLISGASPAMFGKAKAIITAAIIGLVIVFIAWIFLNTFLDYIGVAEWTGFRDNPSTPDVIEGWWQFQCR